MKNFNEIYENVYKENIRKEIEAKEKIKAARITGFIINMIFPTALLIGFFILTHRYPYEPIVQTFHTILLIILYLLAGYVFLRHDPTAKIQEKATYKNNIISSFIKNLDSGLIYEKNGDASSLEYKNSEFSDFNIYDTEDSIKGTIDKKIKVNLRNILLKNTRIDQKTNQPSEVVDYVGLFSITNLTINIPHRIKIYSKPIETITQISTTNKKIKTDSEEFNKHFEIYVQDKIEAMQILTPDIMETLLDYKKTINKKLDISLIGHKLYIRLNNTDIFEPQYGKNMVDLNTLYQYYLIFRFSVELSEKLKNSLENSNFRQ